MAVLDSDILKNAKPIATALGCPDSSCDLPLDKGKASLLKIRMIGVSHRTADLAARASVSIPEHLVPSFLESLRAVGATEAFVLSTCNRTEIYFSGTCFEAGEKAWAEFCGLTQEELGAIRLEGTCAICHLFRVAAGLESAVLGETEILAQIKKFWQVGRDNRSIGKRLESALQHSLRVSKRVRTETMLCKGATSVASLAIKELVRKTRGLSGKTIVVIGAGATGVRVAKELVDQDARKIILNRTFARAEELALSFAGFEARPMSELEACVAEADIIISAITTEKPILSVSQISRLTSGREVALIDLGVPANLACDIELPNVWSMNIDVLSSICQTNSQERQFAVPNALKIIQQEIDSILAEGMQREAAPIIQALVQRGEEVRSNNLEWALDRLDDLDPKQLKVVEDLSIRIIRGMLEAPIQQLKESADKPEFRDAIGHLFGVNI
jgi:glutamyl-tRNA reductase